MKHLLIAATLALLSCACSTTSPSPEPPPPAPQCLPDGSCCGNRVVARVGDAVLTEKALAESVDRMMAYANALAEEGEDVSEEERLYQRESCRMSALFFFGTHALTHAIAARNGITVTPEEVAKARADYDAHLAKIEETSATPLPAIPEELALDFEVALLTEKIAERLIHSDAVISDEEVHAELARRTLEIAALKAEFDYFHSAVASRCVEFETLVAAHSDVKVPLTISEEDIEAVLPPAIVSAFLTTPEGTLTDILIDEGSIALVKILKRTPAQEDTGTTTEVFILTKPLPFAGTFREVHDELEALRLEALYVAFMSEQISTVGVSFPEDPDIEAAFIESFTFR